MQDFFMNCATVLQKYGFSYLRGAGTTLLLALVGTFFGCLIGFAVGALQTIPIDKQRDPVWKRVLLKILHIFLRCYVELFRGTPMIVQMLIMGSIIFASSRNFTVIGTIALGINSGAYVSEIIRGGLMSLDPGQAEAGRSLGLGYIDTMRLIVIPQAFKAILPALGNEFIMLLKDTSLITVIGGKEMVYAAQAIYGRTYEQMFPLIGIACIYLVLVMVFSWLQSLLERRLRQSDRR